MKRLIFVALCAATIAGCGGHSGSSSSVVSSQPATITPCDPPIGTGTMGVCVPKPKTALAPLNLHGLTLIPDVSEFQSCALHSETIFRVYEAGTERQDSLAGCHAREIHRLHAWGAVYAFLRPGHGGCIFQADRTVQITRSVGGVIGPIIADAEVPLPGGFVRCFLNRIKHDSHAAVEYTCPGCGDEQVFPIWIASYPTRPPGKWVAHQFSDNFNCRGIVGDCSINEGILTIRSPKPVSPAERGAKRAREAHHLHVLETERERTRRHLLHSGCRVLHPRRACRPLFKHGAAVNHEIKVLRGRGVR